MPLEVFDYPHSVYDILIEHIDKLRNDNFPGYILDPCADSKYLSGGKGFLGLSEVVKAQWKRECVDLNMTNRDLTKCLYRCRFGSEQSQQWLRNVAAGGLQGDRRSRSCRFWLPA